MTPAFWPKYPSHVRLEGELLVASPKNALPCALAVLSSAQWGGVCAGMPHFPPQSGWRPPPLRGVSRSNLYRFSLSQILLVDPVTAPHPIDRIEPRQPKPDGARVDSAAVIPLLVRCRRLKAGK